MAIKNTTYLGLNKPDYDAVADIEVLNDNADIIDAMFDGTHLVETVNGVAPVGGEATIDLGVTSVNGMTGDVTVTERSVKQLIDIIYPVGTYYETTDALFDPNVAWTGTTWQRITAGRVLIAGGGDYTVGSNYGEKTHKITTAEMPQHNHSAAVSSNGAHSHTASTAGAHTHTVKGGNDDDHSGHFAIGQATNLTATTNSAGAHTHDISTSSNHSHTVTIGKAGSGTAMSLIQPSKAVARWLRTA